LRAHSSVLDGPGEGVVGYLLPTLLAQREMRAERELLVHRDRLGLEITPGVGLVERGGAEVVLPSGNEQQRCAVVVAEVDTGCGVWVEVRQSGLEEYSPGTRDGVALVGCCDSSSLSVFANA
jgi:hypothetical protein